MKEKSKTNLVQIHCLLEKDLKDKLDKYSKKTGLTVTMIIRKSLEEYLKKGGK